MLFAAIILLLVMPRFTVALTCKDAVLKELAFCDTTLPIAERVAGALPFYIFSFTLIHTT